MLYFHSESLWRYVKEEVIFYAINIPNAQVLRDRTPHKGGSYGFSRNHRRVYAAEMRGD
jgi:hypothetical protein